MTNSDRIKVKRAPSRGNYDLSVIKDILDDHFLCHIAFLEKNYPVVIPTLYGRKDEHIYIHGASSSRLIRQLEKQDEICVSVTLVDGLVLARSAFHHSMNYRSVVIFGRAENVNNEKGKLEALKLISEHIAPGRWEEVRKPNSKELKATTIIRIPILEASAKIRQGPPVDEYEDYDLDIWAGEIPLSIKAGEPLSDPKLKSGIQATDSIFRFTEKY